MKRECFHFIKIGKKCIDKTRWTNIANIGLTEKRKLNRRTVIAFT